jgi:beta-glucanase (GH16 family)
MPFNLTADFHTYKVVWQPTYIQYFVDDVAIFMVTQDVRDDYLYLIFSIEVGGIPWIGTPDITTPSPNFLIVDYVKVWSDDYIIA